MLFTSAFALSAFAFLGVSAAPGQPQAYSTPVHSAPPAQSSSASSGASSPPSGGAAGGSAPPAAVGSINCPQASQVCCNPTGGSGANVPGQDSAASSSSSGILGGLLGGLLGGGALDGVGEVLDLRSALTCAVSLIGDGPCSQTTVCCSNTGPGNQICKSESGSNIQIALPVTLGVLGSASAPGTGTSN